MPKVKANNIRRKDGQTLCVGHKMIVTLRLYGAETLFFRIHNTKPTRHYRICLSVRPPVGLPVMDLIMASCGTASLIICGLCNIDQHNNNNNNYNNNNNRHFTRVATHKHLERHSLNIYRSEKCLEQKTNKLLTQDIAVFETIKVKERASIDSIA
jgi:hypothetical protein